MRPNDADKLLYFLWCSVRTPQFIQMKSFQNRIILTLLPWALYSSFLLWKQMLTLSDNRTDLGTPTSAAVLENRLVLGFPGKIPPTTQ